MQQLIRRRTLITYPVKTRSVHKYGEFLPECPQEWLNPRVPYMKGILCKLFHLPNVPVGLSIIHGLRYACKVTILRPWQKGDMIQVTIDADWRGHYTL